MSNICIIPARGGSKRIPRKNIKEFLGKPIIAYSIEAAINSRLFDEVMVSTDDKEIAEIALKYGATVPFLRSQKTSNDFATIFEVIKEVLSNYKKMGKNYECLCCLFATSPFVTPLKLNKAFDKMKAENKSSVFPVIKYSYPIQRSLIIENKKIKFREPKFINHRSQDLKDFYHDSGQFYFITSEKFSQSTSFVNEDTSAYIINTMEAQDIDNEIDWRLAELKYVLFQKKDQ